MIMVLIDKEQTYQTLSEYYHHTGTIQHMALREALDKVPVVDAEPARHGKWTKIPSADIGTCSCCGDKWGSVSVMNYCPNCGADMRGEKE